MKRIVYQHLNTGEKVIMTEDGKYHFLNESVSQCSLPKNIVEDSNDWVRVEPEHNMYELISSNGKIYFKNVITDEEFHIGDPVTLKPNVAFGDGKRDFVIESFYIAESHVTTPFFEMVYAWFDKDKEMHLSNLKKR